MEERKTNKTMKSVTNKTMKSAADKSAKLSYK